MTTRSDTPSTEFRLLDGQDCAELCGIHQKCFSPGWSARDIQQVLEMSGCIGIGLFITENKQSQEDKPPLKGFVILRLMADESEIITIAVLPPSRRQGFAHRLMEQAFLNAAISGATDMYLEVAIDNNSAIELYKTLAFDVVGQRQGYYERDNGDKVSAHIMKKSL